MRFFRSRREPFTARVEGEVIVVENTYILCVHSPAAAGGICEAVIKNGSGKSLFAAPQSFIVGITENGLYHLYKASDGAYTLSEREGNPVLEFQSTFKDAAGVALEGLTLKLRVEYTPWGEALFRAEFNAAKRISDLGMVQVGSLYVSEEM